MARHIRRGLSLILAAFLAVIAGVNLFGSVWTSRSNSPASETRLPSSQDIQSTSLVNDRKDAQNSKVMLASLRAHIHTADLQNKKPSILPVSTKINTTENTKDTASLIHVKPGECLWTLARAYHTSVEKIEKENNLHTTILQIGQALHISQQKTTSKILSSKTISHPSVEQIGFSYTVHPGDSWWRISTVYGVSVTALKQENDIHTNILHAGDKIKIVENLQAYSKTPATKKLIQEAPKNLLTVYKDAGNKYGIPWTVLAAIHKEETDFDTSGNPVSSAGAEGPMQFMPSTFKIYGVAAPGHTVPNIDNVRDAIYSTAHMLAEKGFQQDPYHAIYAYNHSVRYVDDILHMASI